MPNIDFDFIREAIMVIGFAAFVFGVWQIYEPAAWVMGGALLMYVGAPRG